jgi:hypothetical protein
MLNDVFRLASDNLFMPTVVAIGVIFLLLAIYFRRPV